MQITPNEIASIEDAGMLDGNPVKLIRTKGGFWIAVSRLKGKIHEEAIAAGSHPAIVKYNIEKTYPGFQPSLMKSENFSDGSIVEKHSHFLGEELRKSGHDIYSVQVGTKIDFHITKQEVKLSTISTELDKGVMVVAKGVGFPREFVKAVAGATSEKAQSCGAHKIRFEAK